jgi:diadenosine tetraphosphatase ApaH/serine/threonine PP2A family protein phosphatase
LLADIRANVWALEAVLADVRERGVDVGWDRGDILHGDLKPRATYDLLRSADAIEWLRVLPVTALFEDEVLLCHGSPTDDLCYLLEDVTSGHPQVRRSSTC